MTGGRSTSRAWLAFALVAFGCDSLAGPSEPMEFDQWEALAPLPIAVRSAAVATDGARVYVMGGSTESGRTGAVQILDVASGVWAEAESLPEPTDWGTAAWMDGALHFIGGVTNHAGASTQHLVYDRTADAWSAVPPVPAPIAGTAGLTDGSRIYVFAGNSGSSPAHTSTTRIYNAATESWSTGTAVPGARINWSGTYLDGRFYLVGGGTPGLGTSDDLLSYDPEANSWAALAPVPLAREAHGVAGSLGRICAIGGRLAAQGNFNTPWADVSCYDPDAEVWMSAPLLPRALQEVAAVTVDGEIIAVGGADVFSVPVSDVSVLRVR
jgi:N-acetylneuraminic acid mutarotase